MSHDDKEIKKIINDGESVAFDDHISPEIQIPEVIRDILDPDTIKTIETSCLEEYEAAKHALDDAMADVLVKDQRSLNFAGELAQRVLTLIDVADELGLNREPKPVPTLVDFKKYGPINEAAYQLHALMLAQMSRQIQKTKLISESHSLSDVEKGNVSEQGFVGFSPLSIEYASRGNLRERMYIAYKTTHGFTGKLLSNIDWVKQINAKLREKRIHWQLNEDIIQHLITTTSGQKGGIYTYGAYAQAREGSRVSIDRSTQKHILEKNLSVEELSNFRQPLSIRETLAQTGDLNPKSKTKVSWLAGNSWFRLVSTRDHPSIRAADVVKEPMLTGISGTTDSILTLGYMLNMFSGSDGAEHFRDGVTACLGWMIDAKDHTSYEILSSSKSFGFNYQPGPASYKMIRPGDDKFLEDLRQQQAKRGYYMPDEYLTTEYVLKKARPQLEAAIQQQLELLQQQFLTGDPDLNQSRLSLLMRYSAEPAIKNLCYSHICRDETYCKVFGIDFDQSQTDKFIQLESILQEPPQRLNTH